MKNTFAFIATLSAFALTACGGGGSDSPVAVNQPSNGGSPVVNPSTPTTNGFVVSGKAIKFENGKQTGTMNSEFNDQILTVRVDGREMWHISEYKGTDKGMVYVYDEVNKKYTDKPADYTGHFQYAVFGLMYDYTNSNAPTTYLYYTGKHNATQDMPNTGKAHYVGAVFAYRPSDKMVFSDESFYSSKYPNLYDGVKQDPITFDVDFAQKTVKGTINKLRPWHDIHGEQIKDIKLSAKIKGNTFSGTANGVSTEGVFVGPKAVEMTGLFKDDNNKIQGAFGARQQGK